MEHFAIYFQHGIRGVIPYSEFIVRTRDAMAERGIGVYLGDDMAIDGSDAEGIFSGTSAEAIFEFIREDLSSLTFMKGAKVTLIFGELDAGSRREQFFI